MDGSTGNADRQAQQMNEAAELTGTVLRHSCPLPAPMRGMIWRCNCGRRWKVVLDPSPYHTRYVWSRRYLPWNGGTS